MRKLYVPKNRVKSDFRVLIPHLPPKIRVSTPTYIIGLIGRTWVVVGGGLGAGAGDRDPPPPPPPPNAAAAAPALIAGLSWATPSATAARATTTARTATPPEGRTERVGPRLLLLLRRRLQKHQFPHAISETIGVLRDQRSKRLRNTKYLRSLFIWRISR